MTRQQILDEIHQLPPGEEKTALYNEYAAIFHSRAAAPLVPSSPSEAAQRLAQLANTPGYLAKLESKDWETVQEKRRLDALLAEATPFDPINQIGDISAGPGVDGPRLSRANTIDAAADLRAKGASDSEIEFILSDQKYPTSDVDAAHYWLPRMEADPNLGYPDLHPAERAGFLKFLKRITIIGDGSTGP
jgi:hypothetical protein